MEVVTRFLKKNAILLLLVALSFFTWAALIPQGFFTFHDLQQVARLYELDKALWAGQFPVRFVGGLGFGYGYALFNFYPPFIYYLGEFFHLFGFSFVDSIKLVWFTALLGSAVTMFFLAKQFFGKLGGLLSAVLYLYIPYHAIDAYVRGALAELFSFVWLPLILLFSYQLIETGKRKYLLATGLTLGLLMITHNLIFLPFFGLFLLWLCGVAIITKRINVGTAAYCFLAISLGLGLSAFFWVPALVEKQFTLVDQLLLKNLANYQIHFVCPEQLWNSLWGYGGSAAGCIDGMSFKIGKIHLALGVVALAASPLVLFREKGKTSLSLIALLSLGIAAFAAFMTTTFSTPLWALLSPLWYLQFPWRFLEFVALFLCFGAGIIPVVFKKKWLGAIVVATLVTVVIWQNAKNFVPQTTLPNWNDEQATSDEEIMNRVSSSSFEFLPKGMTTYFDKKGDLKVNVDFNLASRYEVALAHSDARVTEKIMFPNYWRVRVETSQPTTVKFPIAVFPGWQAWVDGKKTEIDTNNALKLLTVPVGAGNHTIIVSFTDTPVRLIANLVTLMSTIVLIATWYESRRSQTKTH